ncbi:RadC family protein [Rubritalea marina]|uniref:RadC family protein n=1 Tax=Rubritalea marina TaxID=361055 RepID=UPI000367AB35|nr:DNA repair protein RadC [Rubritalea marina]
MAGNIINDLPEDERPREKLAKWGPSSLSNAELLAIFLRVGTPGKNAIEVASELLQAQGSLQSLGRADVKELARQHGVGPAKAAQIAAAFELGLRAAKESISQASLSTPEEIFQHMQPLVLHQNIEKLYLLLVDSRLKHSRTIELSSGSVNETVCHPRDILHHVLLHQAWGFILVHNHPSGDPSPSRADEDMTHRIHEAAQLLQVRFIDHLIIGAHHPQRGPYYSFREYGKF